MKCYQLGSVLGPARRLNQVYQITLPKVVFKTFDPQNWKIANFLSRKPNELLLDSKLTCELIYILTKNSKKMRLKYWSVGHYSSRGMR